jgi:threonine dehydratase
MSTNGLPTLDQIRAARQRLGSKVLRSPLIPLDGQGARPQIYLKLENLQPTGSFKVRGAGNALAIALEGGARSGVFTTSAGNMAQALAWHAQRAGVPCTVIVPDTAPETKLAGIRRFGARIVQVSWDELWRVLTVGHYDPLENWTFIPPFDHIDMIAGNATIGLEIHEDLPGVRTVLVPFGGGGLIAGVAAALRSLEPSARVIACEPETAAPFAASLSAGKASEVDRKPSFVDGIGAKNVLPSMWDRLHGVVRESRVLSLAEIAEAVRFLYERHRIVAEGAGGSSVAAALKEGSAAGPIVAVVSGGNIDPGRLMSILEGNVPA